MGFNCTLLLSVINCLIEKKTNSWPPFRYLDRAERRGRILGITAATDAFPMRGTGKKNTWWTNSWFNIEDSRIFPDKWSP